MNTTVTKVPMTVEERQVFTALLHLGNFVPQDKQEPFLVALEEASRFVAKGAIRQLPQPAVPPGKAKVQPHMNFLGVLSKKEDLPLARHFVTDTAYLVGDGPDATLYVVRGNEWVVHEDGTA